MKLATILLNGEETAAIRIAGGYLPVSDINRAANRSWPTKLQEIIRSGALDTLQRYLRTHGQAIRSQGSAAVIKPSRVIFGPLYRDPEKIWGIGLNYAAHASDLSETPPTIAPASFMKPNTAIIGYGDTIYIPKMSQKTTAEAELGIIIGKKCRDVSPEDWLTVVAGFTTIIDVTAEDILRQNPRYLTLSKSFDTFFSFGPQLITPDEIEDVLKLRVQTIVNGKAYAADRVSGMTFTPDRLIAFHSRVMTLLPGDVISSGTPGAVPIAHGDQVRCTITGFRSLVNPVQDLKRGVGK